jgi:uncharacterized protein YigE (DUF2233 family)
MRVGGQIVNRLGSEQIRGITTAFLLAAATSLAAHNNSALAETRPCHSMEYERSAYTICEVDLRKQTIRLYWKQSDGSPYAYLSALPRTLEGEAGKLLFATNAGMFDPALKPVGLYVEQGRELVHVNTRSGYGNFHMKPNGVFYISVGGAAVAETGTFLKQRPQADLATQSGPMLVINGRLHPRFDRRSTSLKARNGVGVRADGKIIFAISQGEVSFDAFARLFRDGLHCSNALFLDGGSAASLYAPSLNSHGNIVSLGPMLAVFQRNRGTSRQ